MTVSVSDYIDVGQRALVLGLNIPTGVAILPRNFDTAGSADELLHESTTPTIRSLWRQAGVEETRIEKEGMKIPQGVNKSWEWVGPIIFISQSILTNAVVPLTLNLISSYLYDIWKGHHSSAKIRAEFVYEKTHHLKHEERKETKRVTFEGSPKEWEAFKESLQKDILGK